MQYLTRFVLSISTSFLLALFAAGCGHATAAKPPAQNVLATRVQRAADDSDPLGDALFITGDAVRLDERRADAPVLYVAYPMRFGQESQGLYGAFFTMARDPGFDALRGRLEQNQMPRVALVRPSTSSAWHVAAFLPHR
jgi:hypothetical protein